MNPIAAYHINMMNLDYKCSACGEYMGGDFDWCDPGHGYLRMECDCGAKKTIKVKLIQVDE